VTDAGYEEWDKIALRIRNSIEAEGQAAVIGAAPLVEAQPGFWKRLLNHSWQLSFPQLAASVSAIVVVVALTTVVGLKRLEGAKTQPGQIVNITPIDLDSLKPRQQQTIKYWNARIDVNRARWSPQMRDTFDRNLGVIDQAVNDSLKELNKTPHDEVSEEMLNSALNEKIALLKEFSEL